MDSDRIQIIKSGGQVYLAHQQMGDQKMKQLCHLWVKRIYTLNLTDNYITFRGVQDFHVGEWKKLISISIDHNKIGNKGCKYLSKAVMNNLKQLNVSSNCIDSVGVLHLSKMKLQELSQINLYGNPLEVKSFRWLINARSKNLRYIKLQCSLISIDQACQLAKSELKLTERITTKNFVQINETKYVRKLSQVLKDKFGNIYQSVQ